MNDERDNGQQDLLGNEKTEDLKTEPVVTAQSNADNWKLHEQVETIRAENFILVEPNVWDGHKRAKNWLAVLTRDLKADQGVKRKFVQGKTYFYQVQSLVPGDVVEFGADGYTGSGRQQHFRYIGVVLNNKHDGLTVQWRVHVNKAGVHLGSMDMIWSLSEDVKSRASRTVCSYTTTTHHDAQVHDSQPEVPPAPCVTEETVREETDKAKHRGRLVDELISVENGKLVVADHQAWFIGKICFLLDQIETLREGDDAEASSRALADALCEAGIPARADSVDGRFMLVIRIAHTEVRMRVEDQKLFVHVGLYGMTSYHSHTNKANELETTLTIALGGAFAGLMWSVEAQHKTTLNAMRIGAGVGLVCLGGKGASSYEATLKIIGGPIYIHEKTGLQIPEEKAIVVLAVDILDDMCRKA